ncbi:MAG: MBL fold metallo-hydrolase, partial [Planctomycetes bacterium]|nr:MBL fold metallo-hydrolase [Planctomycetota bacterium]
MTFQPFLLAVLLTTPALRAQELEVYFFEVGQGDATLVISPTGTTFLCDGGDNGSGYSKLGPALQGLGISQLDHVTASHYHADHIGGLDEIWNLGITTLKAWDRGDSNTPGTQSFSDYQNRYSSVRNTAWPGQVIQLGGGATATCLAVEGRLSNGTTVNISNSAQWENSASLVWHIEYGDFDMWLGGDLTGGGNSTTNVESSVAPLIGDVEVYHANHHGSRTSSNSGFLQILDPEFTVISCGYANPYGYPKQEVVDRLNHSSSVTPVWSLTEGVGTEGYLDAGGTVHVQSDGVHFQVSASDGTSFFSACDEQTPPTLQPGDLVVSEVLHDPVRVNDSQGEWFEIAGALDGGTTSTSGISVTGDGSESIALGCPIQLDAGEVVVFAADGLPSRNGGLRPHLVWPRNAIDLDPSQSLNIQKGSTTIDSISWTSSFPGGAGQAAERIDLLAPGTSNNFLGAVASYGLGDLGSPGSTNDADSPPWGGGQGSWIELLSIPVVGMPLDMRWHAPGESSHSYQGWITLSTTPGILVNGTHIPGNLDKGWDMTHQLPGFSGIVPATEKMDV